MRRDIVVNTEFLHHVSSPATPEEAPQIIEDLKDSIRNGVGIAAPQIGVSKQVFVAKLSTGLTSFVNPVLEIPINAQQTWSTEGCMSLPGLETSVKRWTIVDIIEPAGKSMTLTGLDAIIVQHEYDHLKGILLTDSEIYKHNSEVKKKAEEKRKKKAEKRAKNKKLVVSEKV